MRIATWNVNSVRARLHSVIPWLERERPEIVCLQEIRCTDDQFPEEPFTDLGYQVRTHGQKGRNGVAVLSQRTIEDVFRGLPDEEEGAEARILGVTIEDWMILNLYVVNGEAVGSEKFDHKLAWMERVTSFCEEHYDLSEKVLVTGDFNVTFDDLDVYDPEVWHEKILCSTKEREALERFRAMGLVDGLRHFHPEGRTYTWWDYRKGAFRRDLGLRIDHMLLSPPALAACRSIEVDKSSRKDDRPSDHAPVVATFEDAK
ncbi:MAG: exodeoxyribonuclease III [Planctomycetes bacterium]|nr:exodeoxyribonuclease III [Planctomycetota bacterium]